MTKVEFHSAARRQKNQIWWNMSPVSMDSVVYFFYREFITVTMNFDNLFRDRVATGEFLQFGAGQSPHMDPVKNFVFLDIKPMLEVSRNHIHA